MIRPAMATGLGVAALALVAGRAAGAPDAPPSARSARIDAPPGARIDAPVVGSPAWAETSDVTEHLGARLPLDLGFVDAQGRRTTLGSLFDGTHPVLLVLAYYECPQLCSLVLDGAASAIRTLEGQGFALGRQFRAATISFDATERIDQAARKQDSVLARLGDAAAAQPERWPFWVGGEGSVRALTDRLGFRFLRDPQTGAIAHPAVAFVLTPDGAIARYLYGIDYPPRDLRLALLEASDGKTGSLGDRVVMRCFRYDPATRRYGLFVTRFMKLGGAMILTIVIAMFSLLVRHEIRRVREAAP